MPARSKRTLEDAFGHVRLRGEISGYRGQHGSGHAYFSLKDGQARIDAVVWKGVFGRLRQRPQEGLEVVATGRITTFAGKSSYQIVVESLEPAGLGAWMALLGGAQEAARRRGAVRARAQAGDPVSAAGRRRRHVAHGCGDPRHPPSAGGPLSRVRSWSGRYGSRATAPPRRSRPRSAGFNALPAGGPIPRPDVLIVARGGGSIEDLWAFNEECVVRAAFESAIPLISAVGHETDTTLIDYVSDRRAPTPTGAAEMAVPVRADLLATVADLAARGAGAVGRRIERDRSDLRALARALPSADALLAAKRQRLDLAEARLAPALAAGASRHRARLQLLLDRMARRSPDVALANARARLARIDQRPLHALRNDVQRKGEALVQLGRRLVVAREASLERARALQARRADRLLALSNRLAQAGARSVERRRDRLEGLAGLLASLSYRAVLERGYVLVRDAAGLPVRRAADAAAALRLTLQFADGTVAAVPDGTSDPSLSAKPGRRGGGASATTPGKRAGSAAPARQRSLFDA